jgi:hypothetical protein
LTVTSLPNRVKNIELSVYPNPNEGIFTLETAVSGVLTIYNSAGKLVARQEVSSGRKDIDISQAGTGMYFLQLQTKEGLVTKKIVVE